MYFYPEFDSSQVFLTKIKNILVSKGNEVVTVVPNPVRDLDAETIENYAQLTKEKTPAGEINRLYIGKDTSNSLFTRGKRFIKFQKKLKKYLKENINDFDKIYILSNPPIFVPLMVERICKKYKKDLIYEIDDVFPEITGKYSFLKPFAHKAIKNACHIITLSEDMKKTISKWANKDCIIDVVKIWPSALEYSKKDYEKLNELFDDNKYRVTYVGNIGHFQSIDLILDIAKYCSANENIEFYLGGFGRKLSHIISRLEKEKINNVKYIGKLTAAESLAAYSISDLNIISLNKGVINYACPSKTTMCELANKRTLLIMDNSAYVDDLLQNQNFIFDGSYSVKEISNIIINEYLCKKRSIIYNYDFEIEVSKWIDLISK